MSRLGDWLERAAVEGGTGNWSCREFSFQPSNLILEFGNTDRLTLHERFVNRAIALTSAVVPHVGGTVSAHVVTPLVTGYGHSVTSQANGYVTR